MEPGLIAELKRKRLLRPASRLQAAPQRVPSGLADLDRICGGGLPRGRISELVAGPAGGAAVLHAVLAAAAARGERSALVDPADGFDPRSARAAGVDLQGLLWVRPADGPAALRAAELILDSGAGFSALALSLAGAPRGLGGGAWLRLARLAERTGALVLVVCPAPAVGSAAALVVAVERCRARWGRPAARPAGGGSWLQELELSFSLRRLRRG